MDEPYEFAKPRFSIPLTIMSVIVLSEEDIMPR